MEDAEELEELEDGLRVSHRKSREDMGKGRNSRSVSDFLCTASRLPRESSFTGSLSRTENSDLEREGHVLVLELAFSTKRE